MEPVACRPVSPATDLLEAVMDNDKSIMERITETVKDIANIAATAADQALKAEAAPAKAAD